MKYIGKQLKEINKSLKKQVAVIEELAKGNDEGDVKVSTPKRK